MDVLDELCVNNYLGLAGLFPIGKSTRNGVDYTPDLLSGFLFLWRLLLTPLLLVSLSFSVFHSISSSICFVVHKVLLLVSFGSCSCLVVVRSLNKLG